MFCDFFANFFDTLLALIAHLAFFFPEFVERGFDLSFSCGFYVGKSQVSDHHLAIAVGVTQGLHTPLSPFFPLPLLMLRGFWKLETPSAT